MLVAQSDPDGHKFVVSAKYAGDLDHLSTFTEPGSSHEDAANVVESFLLKLYEAVSSTSLNKHRYIMYTRAIRRSSLSSGFKLGWGTIGLQLIGVGGIGTALWSESTQIGQ